MIGQPVDICRWNAPSFLKFLGEAINQRLGPLLQANEINGFDFFSHRGQVAERSQHEEHFFLVERVADSVKVLKELLKKGSILLKHMLFRSVLQIDFSLLYKHIKDSNGLIFLESLQARHHVQHFEDLIGEVVQFEQTKDDDWDVWGQK